MNLPPIGLCLPCVYRDCTRANVVRVEVAREKQFDVWLTDCHVPWPTGEHRVAGAAALEFAKQVLEEADELHVYVAEPERVVELFCARKETISVVRGVLYLSTEETLGQILVHAKHATA